MNSNTRGNDLGRSPLLMLQWSVFAAVAVVSAALRLGGVGRPVWIDEVLTQSWAHGTYLDIFRGNFSPFMPATAKTMIALFASPGIPDELLLRLPHVFFGVAGILLVFVVMWRNFGYTAALASALFLATLPRHIAYSQDARYYAFAMLASTLLIVGVHALLRNFGWKPLCAVLLASFLGIINHLSFLFPLAALLGVGAVVLLLQQSQPLRRRLMRIILLGLAAFLGVAFAAMPFLLTMEKSQSAKLFGLIHSHSEDSSETYAVTSPTQTFPVSTVPSVTPETNQQFLGGESAVRGGFRLSLQYYLQKCFRPFLSGKTGVLFLLSLLLAIAGFLNVWRRDRIFAGMLTALLLIHVPFFFIKVGHDWSVRYFVVQIVALAALSGLGVAAFAQMGIRSLRCNRENAGRTTAAVLVLYAVFLCADNVAAYDTRHLSYTDQGQRSISRTIAALAEPGDTVALVGAQSGFRPQKILKYYLEQDLAGKPALWFSLAWEEFGMVDNVIQALRTAKGRRFWIVTQTEERWPECLAEMTRLGASLEQTTERSNLWYLGGDTVNLLREGGFEGAAEDVSLPECGRIVSGAQAFCGRNSFEIRVSPETDPNSRPMPTLWFSPVRSPDGTPAPYMPENGAVYCLSFMLKCNDLREGKFASRTVRVLMDGKDASGKPFFTDLLRISGTRDWQHYAFVLVSGTDFPPDLRSFRVGIGNRGGSGTFWLDNVQFEKQPHATPFTPDIRKASWADASQ